jgi:hypothetical protein
MDKLLLLPEQDDYGTSGQSGILAVSYDGGPARRRRDFVNPATIVKCSWFLTQSQYQYLKAFYNFAAGSGSKKFLIDLLYDEPILKEYTASFVENSFQITGIEGLNFHVEAEIEIVGNRDSDLDEMVLLYYDEKGDNAFNYLEKLVNVDWFIPNV